MPKANSSSSWTSPHPPIPLPDHHNHPITTTTTSTTTTRRSSSTFTEASSLPPPANAVSSNNHIEHENDDNQNKQIISLPFNWQVKNIPHHRFVVLRRLSPSQASKFSLNDRISALCLNEYMADVHF